LSKQEYRELLPQGPETPENHLFTILDHEAVPVGVLWFAVKTKFNARIAFVLDVSVSEGRRRQGHARRALLALEDEVRKLGLSGIALHVFGHNTGAQALYSKLGYQPTNISLFKPIGLTADRADETTRTEEWRVLAVEDEYVAAEVRRDEDALRRLVDDRFAFNSNDGKTLDKAALISNILGMNMVAQTIRERTVLVDGDIAIVFGTAELRFAAADKEETTSVLRYTSSYVRRGEQWRMLALHMAKRASN
jgi:ketosteroid isomerase-like protein/N-acetylglutamate synthase-like GNAT family acetyltransferase